MPYALFVLLFAVTNGAAASVLGASVDSAILAGGVAGLGAILILNRARRR
jgi:hypothetical protein